jgi:hypothetical protein
MTRTSAVVFYVGVTGENSDGEPPVSNDSISLAYTRTTRWTVWSVGARNVHGLIENAYAPDAIGIKENRTISLGN